jgi:hypothetical protein
MFTVAVECSAMQGQATRRCYVLIYSHVGVWAAAAAWVSKCYTFLVTKRIRHFAIAFLLLTLPMQAMAAASMVYCHGDHHATWLQVATHVLFGHSVAAASASARSGHHDADTDAAHDGSNPNHHDDGVPPGDDHRGSPCSSCTDCCCAASLPSPGQSALVLVRPPSGPISMVARHVSGYVPERLERPPRNTLV